MPPKLIIVSLEWKDRNQGAELVNYLMELHRDAATEDRKKDLLQRPSRAPQESMAECNRKLDKARKAVQDLLDTRGFKGNDPGQRLAGLEAGIKDAETEIRKTEADYNANVRDKGKLEVEIEKLEILQARQSPAKPDKEVVDPEYEKEQKQLEKELRKAEQELQKAKNILSNTQDEYDRKKGLYQRGGVTILDWNNVSTRLKEAKSAVVNGQKDVDELRRDLSQLRPGIAPAARSTART